MAVTGRAGGRRSADRLPVLVPAAALAAALLAGCSAPASTTELVPGSAPSTAADVAGTDAAAPATAGVAEVTPPADEPASDALVTAEPDEHSEVGTLVAGFPVDLLPVPPDAVILVTSAVPVGGADVQEVSLNLRTAASVEDVLTLYRTALLEEGFTEVEPAATTPDLAAEATFTRSGGDELISIGVLEVDGGSTVTIGGRVRTAAG